MQDDGGIGKNVNKTYSKEFEQLGWNRRCSLRSSNHSIVSSPGPAVVTNLIYLRRKLNGGIRKFPNFVTVECVTRRSFRFMRSPDTRHQELVEMFKHCRTGTFCFSCNGCLLRQLKK